MSFDVSRHIDARPLGRFHRVLIAISCLLTFFDGLDMTLMAFVAPYAKPELALRDAQLGLLFSFGMAGMVLGGLVLGSLGDRFGRRPMILICAASFGLLTILTGAARNFEEFALLRLLDGMAIGGILPLAWALNIENSPARTRASVVTSIMVGYGLGAAAAGPLTNLIAPDHGWRMVFVVAGAGSLAAVLPAFVLLPESIRFLCKRGAPAESIARLLKRIDPTLTLRPGAAFTIGDEAVKETPSRRMTLSRLFEGRLRRVTPLLWLAYGGSSIGVTFIASWNPILFEQLGYARTEAGTISAIANAGGTALGLLLMRFTDRFGPAAVAVLPAVATPILLVVGLGPLSPSQFLMMNLLAQTLVGGAHFGVLSIAGLFYPTEVRASGAALAASIGKSASVLGPLLGATLLAQGLSATRIFAVLAIFPASFAVCVALIAVTLRTRHRVGAPSAIRAADPAQSRSP